MKKRFFLFFTGFLIGGVASYFLLFRGRYEYSFTPNGKILAHISRTKVSVDSTQLCKLKCLHITADSLTTLLLKTGDIQFSKSDKKKRPCPDYYVNIRKAPFQFHINLTMCDTTTNIFYIDTEDKHCNCD